MPKNFLDNGELLQFLTATAEDLAKASVPSRQTWHDNMLRKWKTFALPFNVLCQQTGTDCVGHVVRAMTDAHSTSTMLSIDGHWRI